MKLELRSFFVSGLAALFLLLFVMVATMPKGIWADEVLQFAWGAFPDSLRAIELVFRSVGEKMNHGQTGIYMIYDHLALKIFGASYFALRFPSYLSFVLAPLFGFLFLRNMGVSLSVRILFVVALSFSQLNLEHGWEARPYVVLQAAVMGFLWALDRCARGARHSIVALLAFVVAGILFHPFFIAYAGLIFVFSFALLPGNRDWLIAETSNFRRLIFWVSVAILAASLFLILAKLSWSNSIDKKFGLNPYEFIGHSKSVARFMIGTFFYPISIFVAPILGVLWLLLAWKSGASSHYILWRYSLVIGLVIALTQYVITRSVINAEYWILQRQWVAGSALAILLGALLVEGSVRMFSMPERWRQKTAAFVLIAANIVVGWRVQSNFSKLPENVPMPLVELELKKAKLEAAPDIQMYEFQDLAHQNLLLGGPVWPIFQKVYLSDTWAGERAVP